MKKGILIFLSCACMILGVVGCKNSKNKLNIGDKSNIVISKSDVELTIKDGTLTNAGAVIILTNNSDKNLQYSNPYEIEIKKNGEWYKIKTELNFTLPAFNLNAKDIKEIELNWKNEYGNLPSGTYRIIKKISYKYENGKYESFNVAAEFTIR